MRAVQAQAFGAAEVLVVTEVPDPVAGPGEVVVQVAAADVMFLDTRLRHGWGAEYFTLAVPYVPGGAIAGEIIAVGADVDPSWIGKRVSSHTAASGVGGGSPTGGYAERALAKVETLVTLPPELGFEDAAAIVHDGRTAFAVAEVAAFQPGEWVLITGAAGGLGVLLTQIARAAGAHVVAAARGDQKLELVAKVGADVVIDYSQPDWPDRVRAATAGAGVSVALDGIGGDLGRTALQLVRDAGRFLGYGSASGEFADAGFAEARDRGVTAYSLFDVIGQTSDWNALAQRAQQEVAAGRLDVVVGQTFPLDQAADAHRAIEARTALGRTLLLM